MGICHCHVVGNRHVVPGYHLRQQWNRITVHVKGASEEWDLWVNGVLTNIDLAFINSPGANRHLGMFDFDWQGNAAYSRSTDGVFIDQFEVYEEDSGFIYDTYGFEPSSLFVTGTLNNQDGWSTYGNANHIIIQSNRVYENHCQIINNNLT